jgi:hypothetical protein
MGRAGRSVDRRSFIPFLLMIPLVDIPNQREKEKNGGRQSDLPYHFK